MKNAFRDEFALCLYRLLKAKNRACDTIMMVSFVLARVRAQLTDNEPRACHGVWTQLLPGDGQVSVFGVKSVMP